jgi:hypothetical protein
MATGEWIHKDCLDRNWAQVLQICHDFPILIPPSLTMPVWYALMKRREKVNNLNWCPYCYAEANRLMDLLEAKHADLRQIRGKTTP